MSIGGVVGVVVVWLFRGGDASVANVASGVVVALVVLTVFPAPWVTPAGDAVTLRRVPPR